MSTDTLTLLPATRKAVPDAGYRVTEMDALETRNGVTFVAIVERNGERVGTIENEGNGGPTSFHADTGDEGRAFATFAAGVPDESLVFEGFDGQPVVGIRDEDVPEMLVDEFEFQQALTNYVKKDKKRPVLLAGEPCALDKPLRLSPETNKLKCRAMLARAGGGLMWDEVRGLWVEVEGAPSDDK